MKTSKHNHKGTNKLKVCLLSLFLLMPFICFIPTAFYYGFNEQAQAQIHNIEEQLYFNKSDTSINYDWNDLQEDTLYFLKFGNEGNDGITFKYCEVVYFMGHDESEIVTEENNVYALYSDGTEIDVYLPNLSYYLVDTDYVELAFVINENTIAELNQSVAQITITGCDLNIRNFNNTYTETYTMSITDSMSTAWTNTWSNPLFSWVNNNPLKNNIDGFVNWFGITDSAVIPQYLTYIVSIVGIYIVIDIILVLFTHLTHMFSKEQS